MTTFKARRNRNGNYSLLANGEYSTPRSSCAAAR